MSGKPDIVMIESAEELICAACCTVTAMIKSFMICPEEWPVMEHESPVIWKRIEEIEWYDSRTIEETRSDMSALLKNYERLFTRRNFRREKAA